MRAGVHERAGRGGRARLVLGLAAALLAAGCQERQIPLEGPRFELRAPLDGPEAGATPAPPAPRDVPITLPAPVNHDAWTHRNGGIAHRIDHPALSAAPSLAWTADIGQGESRRLRITADPVAAEGRIFTIDARARVSAVSSAGQVLWTRDLTPEGQRDEASGGGLALGAGRLFATTAYGRLVALDPATGAELWVQRFDAPVTGAPTVDGNLVYVVAADSSAWAIEVETGRVQWQLAGAPSPAAMVGGPGPAVTDRLVLFAFPSGEVVATLKRSGIRLWGATVAGQRRGEAYAGVVDITGDPVVVGNTAYVGNQSGRLVALDLTDGTRRWTATEGAYSPVWPAGGSLFLVSDAGALVRIDAATGETIWSVQLPHFRTENERRRAAVFAHYGPVLAGGRLIVPSNDGQMRLFDPASGAELGSVAIPGGGAATNPIVVNGTLYLVTAAGTLAAFR
jgi:outer membrane protein assembly factor BamB